MQRYSVKPISKREVVLYALLTQQDISATELRIRCDGYDPSSVIQLLKWHYLVDIKINKIATYTSYELIDYQKGFCLYEHWLTRRQDIIYRKFKIFDDWVKDPNVKMIANKYNTHVTYITDIISSLIREGALLLYQDKSK